MINFEIFEEEYLKSVKIGLNNDSIRVESGAMYYMEGEMEINVNMPSGHQASKSFLTGQKFVKPVIMGTGEVYLRPTYGEYMIMDLDGHEWILEKRIYCASEIGVYLDIFKNKALAGILSGDGIFQTKVSGEGKVIIAARGPVKTVEINDSKLYVDGHFVLARTGNLEFKFEKSAKSLFRSVAAGEGYLHTYTGTGKVLMSPFPNQYAHLMQKLNTVEECAEMSCFVVD